MKSPAEIHRLKYWFDFFKKIPANKWCARKRIGPNLTYCAVGLINELMEGGGDLRTYSHPGVLELESLLGLGHGMLPEINDSH